MVSSMRHHRITNDYNDGAACLKGYLRYAEAVSIGQTDVARTVLGDVGAREDEVREHFTVPEVLKTVTDSDGWATLVKNSVLLSSAVV